MKRTALILAAAAMVVGVAAPAMAQHDGDRGGRGDRDRHGDWGDRDHRGDWGGGGSGDWISLGTKSFEGRNDRESTFTGWAGRHIERIGFRPVDGDARCMSIVATFDDGDKYKIVSGVAMMDRGRMEVFDLPGRHQNVAKLYMRCRAVGDYSVSIEVFMRK
jgi:hypothetical protein